MEDDGGVKAPVTRLRRRLSVEQSDDTRSPSAPSTPTKKRGGRLAAKPQLELIDEHAVQSSPKKTTRKSIARDIPEPEEKAATPSRRSTRIKSNTSLVSESEDKTLTPSKRNTRVKSNTSIVAESTQNGDTPRAKRAVARRNSQVGSDTEASVTPARTRRTRKGSTSSIDKEDTPSVSETAVTPGRTRRTRKGSISSIDTPAEAVSAEKLSLITEIIAEEPETNIRKSTSNTDNGDNTEDSPTTRKSPRLMAKKGRKSKSKDMNNLSQSQNDEQNDPQMATEESSQDSKATETASQDDVLSISSANLIKELEPKKRTNKNKSTSNIDDTVNSPNRRHRTKSWTSLYVSPMNEGNFYSDNESTKKKLKKHEKIFNNKRLSVTGSGDGPTQEEEQEDTEIIFNTSKKSRRSKNNSFALNSETLDVSVNKSVNKDESMKVSSQDANLSNESNKENLPEVTPLSTQALFEKAPSSDLQSMVFIEDSDSNTDSVNKQIIEKQFEGEDQCVPVVLHSSVNPETKDSNVSCEPMDIDETMPESVSLEDFKDDELEKSQSKKSRKSSLSMRQSESISNESLRKSNKRSSIMQDNENIEKDLLKEVQGKQSRKSLLNESNNSSKATINKSKRKSSMSQTAEDLEKSTNENKSTLVLSQIKDVSATENSVSKSPRVSINIAENIKEEPVNKTLILNYQTSTPVQQKNKEQLTMQMNTSVITPSYGNKKEVRETKIKSKDISVTSKSSDNESSEESGEETEESESKDKSNFLDEAEDAGDDYESGDSQDEEERQYEEENEILEKGETLTSEEDVSNDSDYEKDSFLVSSDEEDNELLSGSGDDLDMSDNELTMSAKSKKKYDERKKKEQKKASREMFESRHNLNESDRQESNKKTRLRLDSSLLESGDGNMVPPKKNKRMRLESTLESSEAQSDVENTISKTKNASTSSDKDEIGYKKKKSKRLSESLYDQSAMNEKEITIYNETTADKDPLSIKIKPEPKTPQKDFDISTVHFTDREEIEQVQVDGNVSIMKPNEILDPLHTTASQEDESDDDASISENEEIANNYDSVLEELNKETKKQIKTHDLSLNLNKKTKQRTKETIVEELNLTETKKSKKKFKDTSGQLNEKAVNRVFKKLADTDDTSSDCIDLKLLFSDESDGGGKDDDNNSNKDNEGTESFIPLKRTPGKTDLRETLDGNESARNQSLLNTSSKKKNKNRIISKSDENVTTKDNNEEFRFFIDTKGDLQDEETNKKTGDETDSDNAPAEISYKGTKSKDRSRNSLENIEDTRSEIKTPKKIKKISECLYNDMDIYNMQGIKTPGSDKKKKNKLSESQSEVLPDHNQVAAKTLTSDKKKKNVSESNEYEVLILVQDIPLPATPASQKKKKKLSESQSDAAKMKNVSESNEYEALIPVLDIPLPVTPASQKKKKLSESQTDANKTDGDELIDVSEGVSAKKRKRKSSANTDALNTSQKLNESLVYNEKKKRKVTKGSEIVQNQDPPTKKRKERDDDEGEKKAKILKENSLDKIHIPRLPTHIIDELKDKPQKEVLEKKKANIVATTDFVVEETRRRKNKPSNYLEETIYLNDDEKAPVEKKKATLKKPKVLPFLPTVSISDSGFTTNFQVHVISQKMEFVAQNTDLPNFKNDYLNNRRAKKLRTYDLYKKHRNLKLSKF